jgi:hypothetical protein
VAATASRSPGARSPGSHASFTTTSPLSQCLPTTRASMGAASELGYANQGTVHRLVGREIGTQACEGVGLLRALEVARLDELQAALYRSVPRTLREHRRAPSTVAPRRGGGRRLRGLAAHPQPATRCLHRIVVWAKFGLGQMSRIGQIDLERPAEVVGLVPMRLPD